MVIEKIQDWDWLDWKWVPDGYDQRQSPTPTSANMVFLAEKLNEVIDAVNALQDRENDGE